MNTLKVLLLALLPGLAFPSWASHIVGGEFELIHLQGYQYRLNLIQYFDEVNGNSEAEDRFADAYIFSKNGEVLIRTVRLDRINSEFVDYTNPSCAEGNLVTRRILYSLEITLSPADFSDPAGYFVVYERCCRNNIIDNLQEPDLTGQTFYMEFPPVAVNGQTFVNSSPALSPPVSDYACVGESFQYDFRSTDTDGDSLVYSLVAPFNSSTNAIPLPQPSGAPQKTVDFVAGIGPANMVPGSPALRVSTQGILQVVPSQVGEFVFSVRIEEYRDGAKIGEIRRDFQLSVRDCNPGTAPVVAARVAGAAADYQEQTAIQFAEGDPRCVQVKITDTDPDEIIAVKLIGVNFEQDIQYLLPSQIFIPENPQDTITFDLCFPACPFTQGPMLVDVVALDNACSQPLTDTLRLTLDYQGPPNEDPYILNNPNVLNVTLEAGEVYELPLQGFDADDDQLQLQAIGEGFALEAYGMSLVEELLIPGEVRKTFRWHADCSRYNFGEQSSFRVTILLSDDSDCSFGQPDRLELRLTVKVPVNNRPKIVIDSLEDQEMTVRIDETIDFSVLARDADRDLMQLTAVGDGFELADYNINFPGNTGVREISSPFSWRLSCNVISLEERSRFDIFFIATDQGACGGTQADTVKISIQVVPPVNDPPRVFVQDHAQDTISTVVGSPVFFNVVGTDTATDLLTLRMVKVLQDGVELDREVIDIDFFNRRGYGEVSSTFSWTPGCEVLARSDAPSYWQVYFVAEDDKCFNAKSDTIQQVIQVYDQPLGLDRYEPANAFTPNQDNFGDYFFLPTLPAGNCYDNFRKIEIFNRWGKLVFSSEDIDFKWYAEGVPGGVYFYVVHYTDQTYRNQVFVHLQDSK